LLLDLIPYQTAMARAPITTHVLDTTLGQPARRVPVELSYLNPQSKSWMILGTGSALVYVHWRLTYGMSTGYLHCCIGRKM